jgi:hypothetical protein
VEFIFHWMNNIRIHYSTHSQFVGVMLSDPGLALQVSQSKAISRHQLALHLKAKHAKVKALIEILFWAKIPNSSR